jgi:multidrug efflux system membrane fusion protein
MKPRMRRALVFLVLLMLAGGGAYWWLHGRDPAPAAQQANARGGRRGGVPEVIPVLTAAAQTRDVPIYMDGLGTVQASASVTVKPMVDGTLLEVRFREGQDVKAGDVLARIDPRIYQAALDQAQAKKAQDQAQLANARADAARYSKLAANAYTSAQQADTARAQVAQLEAQVAADQAQIDTARTQLSYTTITAPIDGRTGIRQVDAGNIVRAGDVNGLVVITTLQPVSVLFTLPQQALPAVSAAMAEGVAEVLALPQESGAATRREVIDRGTLTVLDNQVDPATGTIRLKASFPNPQLRLWPGAFVTVRLQTRIWTDAVTVPPVAVQRGPRGAYVYVITDSQTAERRQVTVGHEDQSVAILAEGLKPGEQVVTDGASRLTDGAKVSTQPPAGGQPPAGRPIARAASRRPG